MVISLPSSGPEIAYTVVSGRTGGKPMPDSLDTIGTQGNASAGGRDLDVRSEVSIV